jgi:hypothetical protein
MDATISGFTACRNVRYMAGLVLVLENGKFFSAVNQCKGDGRMDFL